MVKQDFNLHTHTIRCHHAVGRDEQYILAAIDAGMKTIGFSDHIAYPGVEIPTDRMLNEDMDEYLKTMYDLKEKYKDKIQVLVGFEFEYFEDQKDYLLEMQKKCDYLIIGQHFRYVDGYNYDYFNNDEDVICYAKQIERALELGLTKYIAHPDYFMLGRRKWTLACDEAAKIIVNAAKKYHAVIEINLNGLRYGKLYYENGKEYAYPRREFFKYVSDSSVKVCFGYDAHHPATLLENQRIHDCLEILDGYHFDYVENVLEIIQAND